MVPVAQETSANTVRLPYSFSRRFSLVAWCEASLEILHLKLAVKVASSAQTGELHNAAANTSGSKRFFVLRPVVFLRQTDNVISRQNTMNDSPGLNAVSAARWKCRSAHPCVKP